MNIWILDSVSGIKLLYKSFLKTDIDEFLVSGLLSAFNQFIMTEFRQPIESLEMGGFRWIYLLVSEYNLLFVAADTKHTSTGELKSKLNIIKESFIKNYKEIWIKRGKTWTGDINVFLPFLEEIENYYYDWVDAEFVMQLADFFELLGIFQQLLNLISKSIESNILDEKRENIYKRIEIMFETFKNREDIKDDVELRKFSFTRESGFNVLEINHTNCDPITVRKTLIKFAIDITNIIKDEVGEDLSLKCYRDGQIYNYIIDNMKLLKNLNLDLFFLKLFLLI
ncbi:MAG: hypothetical protein ACFFAH_10035 [Promethearchaeota archaeon]